MKLGDVCEKPQYGYTASAQREEVGPKFLRITDLREGTIDWDTVPCCKVDKTGAQRYGLHHGDVLVARIGATTGSTSIVVNPPPSVFASYLIRLRPTREMHPFFLYFYTKSEQFHQWIDVHKDSNLKGGVNVPTLLSAPLTLPVLAEQKKIAAVLWKMQRAIATQDRLIAATRDLKQSAMQHFFTHGLRGQATRETAYGDVPFKWREQPLGDCCRVQTGVTKGRRIAPEEAIEVPYLRVANVQDGHLDLREIKTITIRERELPGYLLQDGDVVLTEGGDFDQLGRGFIWHGQIANCVHQNHVFAVRAKRDLLLPEFLAYLVQSPYGKTYFLTVAHKTTNLASINSTKLKALPVLLPDLDEQRDIAAALATIGRKLAHHQQKRAALHDLFQTTLHQLMTAQIRVADLDIDTAEVAGHFPDAGNMIDGATQNHVADAGGMVRPTQGEQGC